MENSATLTLCIGLSSSGLPLVPIKKLPGAESNHIEKLLVSRTSVTQRLQKNNQSCRCRAAEAHRR
jgi:hypothetical protein